jgi:hypothetical protein
MHGTLMESIEHVGESPVFNHITASLLAGGNPSDSPSSKPASNNPPITTRSDGHLFSEEASYKREACTSASTPKIPHSSSEQTANLAIVYGLIDLIPTHTSTPGPGEEFSPVRTWWFRLTNK